MFWIQTVSNTKHIILNEKQSWKFWAKKLFWIQTHSVLKKYYILFCDDEKYYFSEPFNTKFKISFKVNYMNSSCMKFIFSQAAFVIRKIKLLNRNWHRML